jgi:uncharacterized protein (TIGR02118 family)
MIRVHIWLRKKEDMSTEEFGRYWVEQHAPIARDGYPKLRGYVVNVVTRVPGGGQAPYDGVAELWWDSRDDFSADMKTDAAARGNDDLNTFTSGFGLLFVEQSIVK